MDAEPSQVPATFGGRLREHRNAVGLTQEALAERAGLSAHGIQKLERGVTQPYRDTAERLSRALQLTGQVDIRFKAAERRTPRRRPDASSAERPARDRARHNLLPRTTSFVGREDELAMVKTRLQESRLLTITGSGGCGKTRLAIEAAGQVVGEFHNGVWLVDLAPLSDPGLIWHALASVLRMSEEPSRPLAEAVVDYLRGRSNLIILDNCEHLIDACAATADRLLREAPMVRLLATSRELLGIPGEAAWRVRSLTVVHPEKLVSRSGDFVDVVRGSEAARLFVDRARLLDPSFELSSDNARAVTQICYRLDGIPLAIELAAARLTSLSVDDVARRLDKRFRLLTSGYRTAVRRQQTLEATIDWSYELLAESERALLRRLSVFAGGWSLDAAEAIGAVAVGSQTDVAEVLHQLVRKSMVVVEQMRGNGPGTTRYRFLETIRQYAEEKLLACGETEAARERHADWYVRLAEDAQEGVESIHQPDWWHRLDIELENLRAALTWISVQPDGDERLLHVTALLGRFWRDREHMQEGIGWIEKALRRLAPSAPTIDTALALTWLGMLYVYGGDVQRAQALLDEAASQSATAGDPRFRSLVMRNLGLVCLARGEYGRAEHALEDALEASRQAGSKREIAWNLGVLASNRVQRGNGDHGIARRLLVQSIGLGRESGDLGPVVYSMRILGHIYASEGDTLRASEIVQEALTIARQIGPSFQITFLLLLLGDIALCTRNWDDAADFYCQALERSVAAGVQVPMAHAVRHYAALVAARGEHRRALRLLGVLARRPDLRFDRDLPREVSALVIEEQDIISAARAALGERAYAEAWAEGETATLAQVSQEILDELR